MSKHNQALLSAKLIQLNQNGVDLIKKEELKFKHFIATLGKKEQEQHPTQPAVFTPTYYCKTCSKNTLKNTTNPAPERVSTPRSLDKAFEGVEEVYFSGGGGAGCGFPAAVKSASEYGLDLSKVKVSVGSSVGAIIAAGIALEVKAEDLQPLLASMPTASFQDWSFWNIFTRLRSSWGVCRGQSMPSYFRQMIKDITGLDDPTFKELYDAGYKKELRLSSTNVSKGDIDVYSYLLTPDTKVAETIALSCSIPVAFPVKRIMNADGKFDIHTDGGIIKNYPWGMGASKPVANEKRLGFVLANSFSIEQGKNITSFLEYLYYLFMLVIFQRPLSLTEEEKQRSIVIKVDYNPINFTPSPPELKYLEDQSHIAVKELAEQLCKNSVSPHNSPKKLRPTL